MKKEIAIALSGGIDSGYAAYLLKDCGWKVCGFTLKLGIEHFQPRIQEAKDLCLRLSVPHFLIDAEEEFNKTIVDYFADSYLSGLTPNPCIYCNEKIKFGLLLHKIKSFGFEYLATGHYARIVKKGGISFLCCGKDKRKTQEYFLARLPPEILPRLVFPLGDYSKQEVKRSIRSKGLIDAKRSESQDICFIKNQDYPAFIRQKLTSADRYRGDIRHISGQVLGRHSGIYNYTYGQRSGLGISWKEPLYVINIDPEKKEVIVGEKEFTYRDKFSIDKLNFFIEAANLPRIDKFFGESGKQEFRVKFRYNSPSYPCRFNPKKDSLLIQLNEKVRGIAPGQLAVLYYKDYVIGSGIIQNFSNP
ncbi:MAG: tRNA 2-thiouridine(34) synthase MnmA [Candidatus Omnitrophica bacterium]|nr:tRNA 2-thiouridine(34) synthase MnmA [Candidatus Omnitrophota bacterium]MBD3268952.1 tRNA 2-thiouridine(34) synthase MnmA [Candidatus Omnitrophota bacterium]